MFSGLCRHGRPGRGWHWSRLRLGPSTEQFLRVRGESHVETRTSRQMHHQSICGQIDFHRVIDALMVHPRMAIIPVWCGK